MIAAHMGLFLLNTVDSEHGPSEQRIGLIMKSVDKNRICEALTLILTLMTPENQRLIPTRVEK